MFREGAWLELGIMGFFGNGCTKCRTAGVTTSLGRLYITQDDTRQKPAVMSKAHTAFSDSRPQP